MGKRGLRRYVEKQVTIGDRVINLKQLRRIGGGWFLPIPKVWLDLMCKENDEGEYWVEINVDANQIIITGHRELLC